MSLLHQYQQNARGVVKVVEGTIKCHLKPFSCILTDDWKWTHYYRIKTFIKFVTFAVLY